jgi:hypothetical protein
MTIHFIHSQILIIGVLDKLFHCSLVCTEIIKLKKQLTVNHANTKFAEQLYFSKYQAD